jgi:hypothetical protein
MKRSYLTVLTLTCLLASTEGVRAQAVSRIVANVPFESAAGGATLPAGTYEVLGRDPSEVVLRRATSTLAREQRSD